MEKFGIDKNNEDNEEKINRKKKKIKNMVRKKHENVKESIKCRNVE
jgi:hypothetical protein